MRASRATSPGMTMSEKHQELNLSYLDKVTGGYGVGDMSDSDCVKLQVAEDQKSQFMEMVSKQVGNAASATTGNLK